MEQYELEGALRNTLDKFVAVTNADERPVRQFGQEIAPGATAYIDTEVALAYSVMEISLALQYIVRKLGEVERRDEQRFSLWMEDRRRGGQSVILNTPRGFIERPSFRYRLWDTITRKRPRWKLF